MDPNETLRLARDAAADGDTLAALEWYEILDEWITRGGFLPTAWSGVK